MIEIGPHLENVITGVAAMLAVVAIVWAVAWASGRGGR